MLAAHQEITRLWWQDERSRYRCVTSDEVLREASMGDSEMSRRRTKMLGDLIVFRVNDSVIKLATGLINEKLLPPAAVADAVHASVASIQQVNILLTWNCRHLANPHLLPKLREFMARRGFALPEICTPIEIAGY